MVVVGKVVEALEGEPCWRKRVTGGQPGGLLAGSCFLSVPAVWLCLQLIPT